MEFIALLTMLVLIGIQNLICIVIGIKIGLLAKGEPLPNPIEVFKEHKAKVEAKKEAKAEQDKIATILKNIENYDGTGFGQMDIPRG